jgi:hypothetical protein
MEITKDQALAELARRELTKRGVPLDAPAKEDKTILPTAMAGLVGAQGSSLKEEGIVPALVGGVSGSTGGMLGMALQNPRSFFQAGYVGANMAQGEDILSMITGQKDRDPAVYSPKTVGGNVVMAASELATGGKTGMGLADKFDDLYKTPGALERLKSMQLSQKGRSEVSKLLPEIKLSTDIKANRPTDAVAEGFNLIKKTNNPVDVANKFRIEKEGIIKEVNQLVTDNNKPINPNFLKGRVKTILANQKKNMSAKELRKLQIAVDDEAKWLDKQGTFDTVKANDRKRYLYQETKRVQEKQAKGLSTIDAPEQSLVKDAFAQAYKESVESAHPDIQKLNARFGGLEEGLTAASKMAERMIEQGSPLQRMMAQIAGRPNVQGVGAAAVREIPQMLKSFSRTTGKIESLANKSAEFLAKSRQLQGEDLLASFMRKQKMAMPNSEYFRKVLTVDDVYSFMSKPKQLTSPVRTYQPLDVKETAQIKGRTVGGQKQLPEPEKFKRTRLASWER